MLLGVSHSELEGQRILGRDYGYWSLQIEDGGGESMKYNCYQIGHQQRGNVVEVSLSGSAANVRLLDSTNYQSYRSGRKHRFYGGLVKRSPSRIPIPHSGTWYVVVDMQGLRGSTRSSVRVIPQEALSPLPEYKSKPLSPLVQSVQPSSNGVASQQHYDVFVVHATEDKDDVARPLAKALVEAGLRVWYDEFELRIGDKLRQKIDFGLARSRFGAVVLSPEFFAKNWTQYELDGLVTREMTGEQVILPLWHRLTRAELLKESPSLANRMARSTSDYTIEQIASEIAEVIID